MFEVGVESLVQIELRAVAWEVKDCDVCLVFGKPCFDGLAVMHAEVIEDQEHFFPVRWPSITSASKNSMSFSWLKAPSMIIQLALP